MWAIARPVLMDLGNLHRATNSRHTFSQQRTHDETYPPQRLCILSIDRLHGALQYGFIIMLRYVTGYATANVACHFSRSSAFSCLQT